MKRKYNQRIEFKEQLGKRLKKHRTAARLTQADIAKVIGVTRVTVSLMESGKNCINMFDMLLICRALGIGIQELLPDLPRENTGYDSLKGGSDD